MCRHLSAVSVLIVLVGCSSGIPTPSPMASLPAPIKHCTFTIASEVDGVAITSPDGTTTTSRAGERSEFQLPCEAQLFQFRKACYKSQRVTLEPESGDSKHILRQQVWEKLAYFRVENDSAHDEIEVGNLPQDSLRVRSGEHSVRRLPLGEYRVEIAARYKESVTRDLKLCVEDDIFILHVGTRESDGELVAQGGPSIELEHGTGQLRVVTEVPNLSFRISPARNEALTQFLEKTGQKFTDIGLEHAPETIRSTLALLQRLDSESFHAPSSISLPAGRYLIRHSSQSADAERLEIEVLPDQETRLELP